mmetsp:Transcript_16860/g.23598  ORF Transcript_16860/g.23598 Transcript_16860/m.23598 type:complete len:101 (-) Transcript_16860:253-555(-)
MMFGRTLVAKRIPREKLSKNMFLGWNQPIEKLTKAIDTRKSERIKRKRERTNAEYETRMKNLIKKEKRLKSSLKKHGVDYDFDGYEDQYNARKSTKIVFE